jgi:hypothetical protein
MSVIKSIIYPGVVLVLFCASLYSQGNPTRDNVTALAWHGQPVSTGGTLNILNTYMPAIVNASGQIVFIAKVSGSEKNQGVFMADETGLYPIAMGCGGYGGSGDPGSASGDPTPIGGTFTGFFFRSSLSPTINDAGDVLFLCDVHEGSSIRAWFLYRAAFGDIIKVVAVKDHSPTGGLFGALGPAALNDNGGVVFLAQHKATLDVNVYTWKEGVISKVVAVGDPAPGGGHFTQIGAEWEHFNDHTWIPMGPAPAMNNKGQVAFHAHVQGALPSDGLFVSHEGTHQCYVEKGDPTPEGGKYSDLYEAHINDAGQIAFYAQCSSTSFGSAWFVGSPGNWRKALGFHDVVGNGKVYGMAIMDNPMSPLDNAGNLLIWCDVWESGSGAQHLVVSAPDGHLRIAAKQGDPTPIGGIYWNMQPRPSMSNLGHGTLSCTVLNAQDVTTYAHFLVSNISTWQHLGHALAGSDGEPAIAGEGTLETGSSGAIHLTHAKASAPVYLCLGFSTVYLPFKGGTLVPSLDMSPMLWITSGTGSLTIPWGEWPGIPEIYFQFWIVDPAGPKGAASSNGLKGLMP